MSEKENDKTVLELPAYVVNTERLGSSVAARFAWIDCCLAPSHLSDTAHVLEAMGNLVIPRELFDRCEVGLRWDKLHLLARRGFVVNYTDSEFSLGSEPYSDKVPDMPYTPEAQTAHGAMQRRGNLTPEEWARLNKPMRV